MNLAKELELRLQGVTDPDERQRIMGEYVRLAAAKAELLMITHDAITNNLLMQADLNAAHQERLRRIEQRSTRALWILLIATALALFAPILVYLLR